MATSTSTDNKADTVHNEVADARNTEGTEGDKMSAWTCIKQNPKVVLCALYANIGAVMVGYDNLALAVCLAMPAFQ